ncbi:amino acid ABC transporter permease [Parendozoicomonas sp. Alg238-R29]|uniref:amino acid ABC transporter permease n=1 Tax=Parendozoicomonas sp. Alg238-R29 TaxID=2993446 RepID=UPI00248E7945|nr:amino acid ABC transporter permease [Parendozoicomonas sp. Alg238-R29]
MQLLSRLFLVFTLSFVLTGCSDNYQWGWYILSPATEAGRINLSFLIQGMAYTIGISILAFSIAMVVGLLVALPGLSSRKPLLYGNRIYVETFRSIPVLVMILWIYYGLPLVSGLEFSAFTAAVIALALCESAFHAEIFRGGINGIDKGQFEASDALGLTYIQKMRLIILPQAIRKMLPPLANQFVYMLKMSSLASVIGVQELTRRANELQISEYRAMEIYSVLVLEYLVLVLLFSWFARKLEKKQNNH